MSSPITKTRGYYNITNYKRGDSRSLEYNLSTWDEVYHRTSDFGFVLDEEIDRLRVPSGLSETKLVKWLRRGMKYDNSYNEFNRFDIGLTAGPRDDRQRSIITFLCTQNDYKKYKGYPALFVDLDTGDGKTYCAVASMCYYQVNALITTPSDNSKIITQWYDSLLKFSTLKERDILVVRGSKMCKDIAEGKYPEKKVFILPRSTAQAFMKSEGKEAFDDLTKAMKVGCHYIDEAHKDTKTMMNMILHSNIYRTVFITATFGRSDKKEHKIYQDCFGSIPRYGSKLKTKEENHINVKFFKFYMYPTFMERKKCKTKYGLSQAKYEQWLMSKSDDLFEVVDVCFDYAMSRREQNGKLLILVSSIKMIKHIAKYFKEEYPQYSVGQYHSEIPKKEREAELDNDIVIATEKGMGTGAEFENHQLTINLLSYSSNILGRQISGRNRKYKGRESIYIEPINMGFPEVVNQFYRRKSALEKKSKNGETETFEVDLDMIYEAQKAKASGIYYGSRGIILDRETMKVTFTLRKEMTG